MIVKVTYIDSRPHIKVVFEDSSPINVIRQDASIYVRVQFGQGSSSGGGGGAWGEITGTLSAQTDLQAALDGKQATSLMTNYLGTGYTTHTHNYMGVDYTTHTHSQYVNTSQSSLFQQSSAMSSKQDVLTGSDGQVLFKVGTSAGSVQFGNLVYPDDMYNIIAGGTQTAGTLATVVFSNSNNVTFGLNGSVMTASASFAGGVGGDGFNRIAAGTQTAGTNETVIFSNSNNISFGLNNGTVTGSASFNQSVQTQGTFNTTQLADYRATSDNGQLLFTSQSSLFALTANDSLSLGTGYTTHTHSQYVNTSQSSLFQQTSGMSNYQLSSALTSKQDILTGADGQVLFKVGTSAGSVQFGNLVYPDDMVNRLAAGSQTAGTLATVVLSNSNNVSFGMSNSSVITASFSQSVQTQGTFDTNQLTNYLTSQSNQAVSGSNGSFTFQTLSFGNLNGMSFYTSNGSLVASYTDAGAGGGISAVNLSAGTTSNNLTNFVFSNSNNITFGLNGSTVTASFNPINIGISTNGNTGGTTGTFDGANLQYLLVGSGNVTLSQSSNGSSVSLTIDDGVRTLSGWNPYMDIPMVAGQLGAGTIQIDPMRPNDAFQFDRVAFPIINTNSSNSSGSHTISAFVGIYTRNVSTLSLLGSTSISTAITHSGTAGSYSWYSGVRLWTIGTTGTLTRGDYWLAFMSRTTSGGANGTYSQLLGSNVNSVYAGLWGQAQNTTMQLTLGQGIYSATSSALPTSIPFSQIRGSDSGALRAPIVFFASSTI